MIEGQLVTPTLRLVRTLGQGGMGSVWVADHLALHTQVAVKFMYAKFAQNADFVRRFQTEAIAAAAIKSPHVAQVFDHGITDEYEPYIVMELLDGEDLRSRLKRGGPLSPPELAPILTQVCKALGRAHQLGIIHRDIKPDNIFLVNMGDEIFVKVLDFGIAKLTDDTLEGFTMTGNTLGTPYYMSPEQLLSSRAVDLRSDLWSLGVVAYQALTGARPFRGETIGAVSVAVNAGNFPLPSVARTGLTPAIDAWVAKSLQRDPAHRFSSAKEMAEAFEVAVRNTSASDVVDLDSIGSMDEPGPGGPAPDIGPRTPTGPTLAGMAHTESPARSKRTGLVVGLAAAAVALAIGGAFAVRTTKSDPAPAARDVVGSTEPTSRPTTASTAGPSGAAEATAPSGSPVASASSPAVNVNDLPSAPSNPVSGPVGRHVPGPGPGHAAPPVANKPTAAPAQATPAPNKDTIGF